MHITLTARHIDAVLSDVEHGLTQYLWIQNRFRQVDVRIDAQFQRAFNSFYRVLRNRRWRDEFFRLLESGKECSWTFGEALDHLFQFCGRFEASFAGKLVATLNPNLPVVDSIVLDNVGAKIPRWGSEYRRARILDLYDRMRVMFEEFLRTETGVYLVEQFQQRYGQEVTETKCWISFCGGAVRHRSPWDRRPSNTSSPPPSSAQTVDTAMNWRDSFRTIL
jgi:hypothetical protein